MYKYHIMVIRCKRYYINCELYKCAFFDSIFDKGTHFKSEFKLNLKHLNSSVVKFNLSCEF